MKEAQDSASESSLRRQTKSSRSKARRKDKRATWPWWLGIFVAFAAGAYAGLPALRGMLAGGPAGEANASAAPDLFGGGVRAQPVSVGQVQRLNMRVVVNAIGTIAPANTTVVRSRVDGQLKALHVKEGQPVEAGTLLAELDDRPFRIALAQVKGTLARDQASLESARRDAARFRDLLAKDGVARQQVEQQEALVAQLTGTVQAGQAQVDNAALQLSYTRITAPMSGVIGLKQVDVGNFVRATDPNGIATINQMQPVHVLFSVPERHLPRIRQSLSRGESLSVEAWDRELSNRQAVGQLASVDNAIDATTGSIRLKAQFANADKSLYPNQFVNVRLQVETLNDTLVVPTASLMRTASGTYVFLVGDDNRAQPRVVLPGEVEGEWVSVKGDLYPGERVVIDGTDRLLAGTRVDVIHKARATRLEEATAALMAQSASSPPQAAPAPALAPAPASTAAPAAPPAASVPVASAPPATPAPAPAATTPPAPVPASAPASAASRSRESMPAWIARLPPEQSQELMKLSPRERREVLMSVLEPRVESEAAAVGTDKPPPWFKRMPPANQQRFLKMSLADRRATLMKQMVERAEQ